MGMTNLGQNLKARAPRLYSSITGTSVIQQLTDRVRQKNGIPDPMNAGRAPALVSVPSGTAAAPASPPMAGDGTTAGILVSAVPRGPRNQNQTSKVLLGQ